MKDKMSRLKRMSEAVSGADLKTEQEKNISEDKIEMKNKNLRMPKEWDEIIGKNYAGSVTSYILMAIQNQMKEDGLL
ncbi:MAG: hypothetical protein ABGW85_05470, partial [Sulfurimonas sp.]